MRYEEKQQASELIDKNGWPMRIAGPKFGFENPESFRKFLKSDRKCLGIEFMRSLRELQEDEDV